MFHSRLNFVIAGLFTLGLPVEPSMALAQTELAKHAQAILKERCYSCHGESGANEGGFNYALNRKRLVRELVVPGDAAESKLLQRVVKGEMPPDGDRLPKDEIETLRKWIEADAPAFGTEIKRQFVSPVDMLSAMLNDLEKATERDRPFYRYFTLTHLYNAGFEDNELESHRQGLSKLVNSLSWGREVHVPIAVEATKTILRIDLRHYKWNENDAWTRIIAADPYRVTYSEKAAQFCYTMSKCELPHVRADWFVFSASRPPLYNIILGLPSTPDEMLKFENERLGVNVARNLQDYNDVMRAGFYPSGVSKANRMIERHLSSYGAYWKSYDFKPVSPNEKSQRRRNLKANPTGPEGADAFDHDGGEMIFSLPNGLQGYMLTDAKGQQIPKGPTDVVVDKEAVKRGRDPEVVNGVSCMNCHWSGMLSKSDQIRDHVLTQPDAYTKNVVEFVTAVYVPKNEFNAKLKEDRERFEAAVKRCGLLGLSKSEPVATLAFQFDEPLDLDLAAAEAGVATDRFVAALRNSAVLGRELGSLPQGQPVPRDTYVQLFGLLVNELKVGTFLAALSIHGSTPNTPTGTARPSQAATAKEITSKSTGMKLTLIPAGTFQMGSPPSEADRGGAEGPQHTVRITQAFYMGIYEVTQAEYESVMGTSGYFSKTGAGSSRVSGMDTSKFPVEFVKWENAQEFCRKLSLKDGHTYRLPTEAEWEYACRANTTTPFHFGGTLNGYKANVDGNEPYGTAAKGKVLGRTTTVGSYSANAFGLFDMHGNVREWCEDVYDESAYGKRSGTTSDPRVVTGSEYRVLRGGSWISNSQYARSADRGRYTPFDRNGSDNGLRMVVSASAVWTP